jgi:hypothetical protein
MTKGIENMLNLPSMEDIIRTAEPTEDEIVEVNSTDEAEMNAVLALAQAAEQNLAIMNGDGHEEAMDEIHKETLKHARDLMDLGFNVDQRSAATIFEKANMLYKTAMDAKNSKRDAQLKAMKLALDKKKLELDEYKMKAELGEKTVEVDAVIVEDRNELIKRMREQAKLEKSKPN